MSTQPPCPRRTHGNRATAWFVLPVRRLRILARVASHRTSTPDENLYIKPRAMRDQSSGVVELSFGLRASMYALCGAIAAAHYKTDVKSDEPWFRCM